MKMISHRTLDDELLSKRSKVLADAINAIYIQEKSTLGDYCRDHKLAMGSVSGAWSLTRKYLLEGRRHPRPDTVNGAIVDTLLPIVREYKTTVGGSEKVTIKQLIQLTGLSDSTIRRVLVGLKRSDSQYIRKVSMTRDGKTRALLIDKDYILPLLNQYISTDYENDHTVIDEDSLVESLSRVIDGVLQLVDKNIGLTRELMTARDRIVSLTEQVRDLKTSGELKHTYIDGTEDKRGIMDRLRGLQFKF